MVGDAAAAHPPTDDHNLSLRGKFGHVWYLLLYLLKQRLAFWARKCSTMKDMKIMKNKKLHALHVLHG
jgi:hypothetical protein